MLCAHAIARKPAEKTLRKKPAKVFVAKDSIDAVEGCLRPKVGDITGNLVTDRPPGRVDFIMNNGFWIVSLLPDASGTRIEKRNLLTGVRGMDRMIEDCGGVEVIN